ncbi:hypothetical protein [Cohnella hongkongensis]|uniref:Uncharacterized protein n=1 Tax=Cohnella hongkongensis TaxID=178337 RepID=A0ABV9F789_9BACL
MKLKWFIVGLAFAVAGCAGQNGAGAPSASPDVPPSAASPSALPSREPGESAEAPVPSERVLDTERLSPLFGFADEQGGRLMALTAGIEHSGTTDEASLNGYRLAIGEGGQVLRIRYDKHQARSEQDNGRQAAHNFDQMEGDVYTIEEGKAKPNESYYLVGEEQFDVRALIPLQATADRKLPEEAAKRIAEAKGREIEQGWLLARGEEGQRLYAVQFQRQGEEMLASLVWQDEERFVFMDYPAVYDEYSTWRVDDGGQISPDMFRFLFAARSEDGVVLGVQWMGAEGENLDILTSSGDRFEETGLSASRYLSPI